MGKQFAPPNFNYFTKNEKMKTFQTLRQNVSLAASFGGINAKSVSKISIFNF